MPAIRPAAYLPVMALALLLFFASSTFASSGDRHGAFTNCHAACLPNCTHGALPLYLRLLGWSCSGECSYVCAHHLTDLSDSGYEHYHQFFGKWAFYRFMGAQEPASVIFSIGNAWIHWTGFKDVCSGLRKENRLQWWLKLAALAQINTWVWSTVFHTRDLWWTERLDYFSATVTIAVTMLYAVVRIFRLQTPRATSPLLYPVCGVLALIVVGHFIYVSSLDHFPYGYHVAFAASLGMLGNLLWISWSVSFVARPSWFPVPYPTSPYSSSRPLSGGRSGNSSGNSSAAGGAPKTCWTPTVLVVLTLLAMSFEILDFPPFHRVLDAHALWHAATIPLGAAWWAFLIKDANAMDEAYADKGRE